MVFNYIEQYGDHEQIMFFQDASVNLKGIIAIHNTTLGPALGGCRIWPYKSEEAALVDVLKLSRGMTYKAAVAGLDQGGGKSVIICDPEKKTPEMLRAFGRFIHSLNGKYITAEDVGTSVEDMNYIRESTPFVTGLAAEVGGSGDPSPFTAQSTFVGIKAAVHAKLNKQSLKGLKVAVQGIGHVGAFLAEYLLKEGCELTICDIFEYKARKFQKKYPQVKVVSHEKIYDEECDIFSPCALGAIINPKTLKRLRCSIIAGAANNQLDRPEIEKAIGKKGILYVPDFVINAGGVINVWVESRGNYSVDKVKERISKIYSVLIEIFSHSNAEGKTATEIAKEIAIKRIKERNTTT